MSSRYVTEAINVISRFLSGEDQKSLLGKTAFSFKGRRMLVIVDKLICGLCFVLSGSGEESLAHFG